MNIKIFPDQCFSRFSQGSEMYKTLRGARGLFEEANEILGFRFSNYLFSDQSPRPGQYFQWQTATYLLSVISWACERTVEPIDSVAGVSSGEYAALVACGCLGFGEGLRLVYQRGEILEKVKADFDSQLLCVEGVSEHFLDELCREIEPQGLYISGYLGKKKFLLSATSDGLEKGRKKLEKNAKSLRLLPYGLGIHSPLMSDAGLELKRLIEAVTFREPIYPIYLHSIGKTSENPEEIRRAMIAQITSPIQWKEKWEINDF